MNGDKFGGVQRRQLAHLLVLGLHERNCAQIRVSVFGVMSGLRHFCGQAGIQSGQA